ncbi:MAG: hypothetical protein ACJA1R_001913, partial [Flavobacteriales bacterium]
MTRVGAVDVMVDDGLHVFVFRGVAGLAGRGGGFDRRLNGLNEPRDVAKVNPIA